MTTPVHAVWWQWPLRHELVSSDIPKFGEEELRSALESAVASGSMAVPALDCLPDAEDLCGEALCDLRLKLVAVHSWYRTLPADTLRRGKGGIVNVRGGDRVLFEIEYVGRDLRFRPSSFATESARFRSRLRDSKGTSWDAWRSDPFRVVKSALRNHLGVVSTETLNKEMFWIGSRVPSICPVLMATVYHALGSRCVLDLSAGWGDRLSAAIALPQVEEYLGFDPNPNLVPGMQRLVRQAHHCKKDPAKFRVMCRPAEDAADSTLVESTAAAESAVAQLFDTMLTSPPYWDKELYDLDPATNGAQSVVRHPTLDSWLGEFWPAYCESGIRRLRPGGKFVLHMHDTRDQDPWVDRARAWLDRHPRLMFLGVMAVRECHSSFNEPLWIWAVRAPALGSAASAARSN